MLPCSSGQTASASERPDFDVLVFVINCLEVLPIDSWWCSGMSFMYCIIV